MKHHMQNSSNLPLSAMDLLRRTDEAAQIIQQRVRNRLLNRDEKPLFEDIVDQIMQPTDDDDDDDELAKEGNDDDDDDETSAEWDLDRIYSLLLVAVFSVGMMVQRCVACFRSKLGKDDDENDVEAVAEIADFAQGTGTEFGNPFNTFTGGGGGGGGGAGGGGGGGGGPPP